MSVFSSIEEDKDSKNSLAEQAKPANAEVLPCILQGRFSYLCQEENRHLMVPVFFFCEEVRIRRIVITSKASNKVFGHLFKIFDFGNG